MYHCYRRGSHGVVALSFLDLASTNSPRILVIAATAESRSNTPLSMLINGQISEPLADDRRWR